MSQTKERQLLRNSPLRHMVKSIYMAVPFKKQVFSWLKKVWIPPPSIMRYLYFRGPFTVRIGEKYFYINHGFDVETSIFWYGITGAWEKISMSAWIKLCERSSVIFDIGANTGIYSLVAKNVNAQSKVYSFEPVKRIFEKLVANANLNRFDIKCEQVAISNYEGEGVIYDLLTEHIYSVTLNKNLNPPGVPVQETTVITKKLSTFIKEEGLSKVDLIKIDVESHEPEVLEGMGEYLANMPTLLLEVWNNEVGQRVEQILQPYDYMFFRTNEIQPFCRMEHIENPEPARGYVSYLVCKSQIASSLELI